MEHEGKRMFVRRRAGLETRKNWKREAEGALSRKLLLKRLHLKGERAKRRVRASRRVSGRDSVTNKESKRIAWKCRRYFDKKVGGGKVNAHGFADS